MRPILAYCTPEFESAARLAPREREILAGFASEKRRRDWTLGRLAAKDAAARWLAGRGDAVDRPKLEISTAPDGRPEVVYPGLTGLPFVSISHCEAGGFAAAHGAPVGADWELVADREPGVVAYFACDGEDVSTSVSQTALWTVKESVLKMLGLGIAGGLKNVRWDGKTATLSGDAEKRWKELGGRPFAVDQWSENGVCLALAHMEPPL